MTAVIHMLSHTDPKDDFIELEPGAVVVSSPSFKNSYTTMTNNLKMSIEKFNLRDCVLASCQELNRAEFFLLLQASLLVFCPSLGLSIIFQYYDVDDQFTDQQDQDEQYIEMMQQQQNMTQEQTQFAMDQQQSMTQTQMQQFVQFVQQLITSMRSDVAQQFMTESQQPQFAMTKSVQSTQSVTANNARIIAEEDHQGQDVVNGEEEDVNGNRPFGEGRQGRIAVKMTTKTWRTVVIHF